MSRRSRLEQFAEEKAKPAISRIAKNLRRSFSAENLREPKRDPALGQRLLTAAKENDVEVIRALLLNPECDPSAEDHMGRTALHYTAAAGNMECVALLVAQQDADINASDNFFSTAFMEATQNGHSEVGDFLKHHGALDSAKFIKKSGPELQHHNHIRHRRRSSVPPQSPKKRDSEDEGMETGDVVDQTVLKKIALAAFMPFVVLLLMQGSWFLICFFGASTLWFVLVLAFLVTELSIHPPWYRPTPGAKELSKKGLPPYWQGIYTNPKYDLDIDFENITFKSDDYTLRGWWIPGKQASKKCLIFVHGGGRDRRAWLRHVEMFHKQDEYSLLLFDFREHGSSDGTGRGFCYGVSESRDVRAAARWVRKEYGMQKVAVLGTSVGGSSAILATQGCPDIDCVVSENPVSHASSLQDHHLGVAVQTYLGNSQITNFTFLMFAKIASFLLRLRIGYFANEAIDVIPSLGQPILIMHGTGDEVVPTYHSEDLFAAAREPKELWLAPDAFHCGLYNRFPEEFQSRVMGFLTKYMQLKKE